MNSPGPLVRVLLASCALATLPVRAVSAGAESPLQQVQLALEVAQYGDRRRDPMALLVAARLMAEAGARASARPEAPRDVSREALLDRAARHADGRQDVLALIAEERDRGARGATQGPFVESALIPIGAVQRLVVTFAKGARAAFGLSGDRDEDIDLEILDASGKTICTATGPRRPKRCDWVPEAAGEVQIRIINRAKLAAEFTFFHN